jgi:hypothetical protein
VNSFGIHEKAGRGCSVRAGRRDSGRNMLRPYGILLRQHIWVKKAEASSRTPQDRGETPFGVRRVNAAFAGALKLHFLYDVGICGRMMAPTPVFMHLERCDFDLRLAKGCK